MAFIKGFRDLIVFQKAYQLGMDIFKLSSSFPKEEQYSLTDQIRRSSRSVTANIAEAWAKRIYIKSFVSKMSDSYAEEQETEVWLDYSKDCGYIDEQTHNRLMLQSDEIRKMLISMINTPEKFCKKRSVKALFLPIIYLSLFSLLISHHSPLITLFSPLTPHLS